MHNHVIHKLIVEEQEKRQISLKDYQDYLLRTLGTGLTGVSANIKDQI
jgi:hypothetical protein